MKPHKTTFIRGGIFPALLSCTAILSASQAAAFGAVNVMNIPLLAQARNIVSNGQNQIMELTQIRTIEQQQLDAMGPSGTMGSLLGSSGMSSVGSQSDFYTNMQKFAFDPCAVNLCQSGSNPVGTTDIEEAREWAMKNFFAGEILNPETERDLYEVRRRGAVNAAVDGMAIATITHNELAGAGQQADALDQVVTASQNLRGDIRANSAIALASYKIQVQQLAMLTSLVEIQAMNNINSSDIYHEEGGTSFPDAYMEEDFSVNNRTQRINVTPPRQGSASGGGLGGALTSSLSGNSSIADILSGAGINAAGLLPTNVASLADAVQSGALPSIQPSDMTMSAVVADAAAVARTSLETAGASSALQNSMTMVQAGMVQGGTAGNAMAQMGLAQTLAATGGNRMLSAALTSGAIALDANDAGPSISFAQGVLRDLAANGVTGNYVNHIEASIAAVEAGSQPAATLVLDSAAILSALGSDTNRQVADILQVDPAGATAPFFQQNLSVALQSAATSTGNAGLASIADTLGRVTQQDVDALRQAMERAASSSEG